MQLRKPCEGENTGIGDTVYKSKTLKRKTTYKWRM